MSEFVPLNMEADRVCDAISKIGYSPAPALLDICDNSVTAKAKNIKIIFLKKEGRILSNKNNVESYTIVDDGKGMTDKEIETALTLGSPVKYSKNSLSKYGFGLKSAGLSLGNSISILSKKNGKISSIYTLDRTKISESGFGVFKDSIENNTNSDLKYLLEKVVSGTIVYITSTVEHHDSIIKTKQKLEEQAGVIYQSFIKKGLNIEIGTPNNLKTISATDILHWDEAIPAFINDKYCGTKPIKVLDEKVFLPDLPEGTPSVLVKACLFPQNKMKSVSSLTTESKKRVESFKVCRERKGAFIYRNGRLISWGHSLDGLVGRDYLGLRVKIEVQTAHDEAFHVDVSKQHFVLPESFLNVIERLLEIPKSTHKEVFERCKVLLDNDDLLPEGSKFNERNVTLSEDDPDEELGAVDTTVAKVRGRQLASETKTNSDKNIRVPERSDDDTENDDVFKRIMYSSSIKGNRFWKAGFDLDNGTFTSINKNHEFYHLIISNLGSTSWGRQALEALIYSMASAEVQTSKNLTIDKTKTELDIIKQVIDKFNKVFSHQLEAWALRNQDVLKDD